MPPKTKAKSRALKGTSAAKPTLPSPNGPPAPYTLPSKTMEPVLSKLLTNHIYITHIDTKPRAFKRQIFAVPVLMNIALICAIIWRLSVVGPFYKKVFFSLMGQHNETTINTSTMPLNETGHEVLRRTMVFMIDFLIYVFVWPWPREFFLGRKIGNPIAWRFGVGFRDKEIIVRRSRKWDQTIGNVLHEGSGTRLFEQTVKAAVDPLWMEKTGYLMLTKYWDLDWKAMVQATKLVDKNKMSLDDFKTTIYCHNEDFGWMVMEVASAGGSAQEEEGRRKILAFKQELTAMGKENLFFRWIELVQYESSLPGGFGPEQQQKTMAQAKEMFEAQGVDFEKFWEKIGGMQGLPGMDGL